MTTTSATCHPECEPTKDGKYTAAYKRWQARQAAVAEAAHAAAWDRRMAADLAQYLANEQELRRAWLACGGCIDENA